MMTSDSSLKALLRSMVDDTSRLFRQELRLARVEATENVRHLQSRMVVVLAGLLLGFSAVLILLEAIVMALAETMPAWAASVVVAAVVGVVAFIMVHNGQKGLHGEDLVPKRAMRQVKADKEMVMEKVA
jgi:hypothetical protein